MWEGRRGRNVGKSGKGAETNVRTSGKGKKRVEEE